MCTLKSTSFNTNYHTLLLTDCHTRHPIRNHTDTFLLTNMDFNMGLWPSPQQKLTHVWCAFYQTHHTIWDIHGFVESLFIISIVSVSMWIFKHIHDWDECPRVRNVTLMRDAVAVRMDKQLDPQCFWNVTTQAWHSFSVGSAKPPLKLMHGWLITYPQRYIYIYMTNLCTYVMGQTMCSP